MNEILFVIAGIIAFGIIVGIIKKAVKLVVFLVIALLILGMMGFLGEGVQNKLHSDVDYVVEQVSNKIGDTDLVRVDGDDEIELFIKEEWVPVSEIKIVDKLTESIVIEYGGEEINIMDSGLTNALKFLDSLDFLR